MDTTAIKRPSWTVLAFALMIATGASAQDTTQIRLSILQGDGQVTTGGRVFARQFTVLLTDVHGIPFKDTRIAFYNDPCIYLGGLPCLDTGAPGHFEAGSDHAIVTTDALGIAVAPAYYAGDGVGPIGVSAYPIPSEPPYYFYTLEALRTYVNFQLTERPETVAVPLLSRTFFCLLTVLLTISVTMSQALCQKSTGSRWTDWKRTRGPRNRLLLLSTATLAAMFSPHAQAGLHRGAEYDSLVSFYSSTNGANWTNSSGWLSGDACGWLGITCDQDANPHDNTSHVTEVTITANNLTGTIPSLVGLTKLRRFDVQSNLLAGSIPSLTGMTSLSEFYVNNNLLVGAIPALSSLTNLQYFSVDSNQLTGSIPPLDGMSDLHGFDANSNQLTGTLPPLTGLTGLVSFAASSNELTGSIPSLAGLSNLQNFYVHYNQLTGPIPPLTGLTALQFFYVQNNHLTGPIPSLAGLTTLVSFSAASNQLTGPIPSLAGVNILQYLYVGANQLSGAVPSAPETLRGASLCPNLLDTTSQPTIDTMWNSLTYYTPWWAIPYSTNECDDLFTDGFGDPIVY